MNKPVDLSVKTYHGGCPHDCPDTCSMVFTVKDEKLISVTGQSRSSDDAWWLVRQTERLRKATLPS